MIVWRKPLYLDSCANKLEGLRSVLSLEHEAQITSVNSMNLIEHSMPVLRTKLNHYIR